MQVQTGGYQYAKSYVKKETDEINSTNMSNAFISAVDGLLTRLDKYQLEGQFIYDENLKEYTLMLKHI